MDIQTVVLPGRSWGPFRVLQGLEDTLAAHSLRCSQQTFSRLLASPDAFFSSYLIVSSTPPFFLLLLPLLFFNARSTQGNPALEEYVGEGNEPQRQLIDLRGSPGGSSRCEKDLSAELEEAGGQPLHAFRLRRTTLVVETLKGKSPGY